MTPEKMRLAGELSKKFEWTDDELKLIIKANELVLSYLQAKGAGWNLAIYPLRLEQDSFNSFLEARKRK